MRVTFSRVDSVIDEVTKYNINIKRVVTIDQK